VRDLILRALGKGVTMSLVLTNCPMKKERILLYTCVVLAIAFLLFLSGVVPGTGMVQVVWLVRSVCVWPWAKLLLIAS
jgi:hypothetical protein